jgi:hypothetical protein
MLDRHHASFSGSGLPVRKQDGVQLRVARLSYRLDRRAQRTLNGSLPNNGHYQKVLLQRGIQPFFLPSHADRMRIKALVEGVADLYVRRQLHFARGTGSSLA